MLVPNLLGLINWASQDAAAVLADACMAYMVFIMLISSRMINTYSGHATFCL